MEKIEVEKVEIEERIVSSTKMSITRDFFFGTATRWQRPWRVQEGPICVGSCYKQLPNLKCKQQSVKVGCC